MIGYLIYPATTPKTNNAFSWFCDAAMQNGITLKVLFYNTPTIERQFTELPLPDFVFLRGYHIPLSRWYESNGVKVINPTNGMIACRDKYITYNLLDKAGIPTPLTSVPFEPDPSDHKWYSYCLERFGSEFIIKQLFGSKGENVYLVRNEQQYMDALQECLITKEKRLTMRNFFSEYGATPEDIEYGSKVIAQEYIGTSYGKDIRVWVFQGRVIGHILRYNDNNFKSNFAQGGSYKEIHLPDNAAEIALKAADTLGLDFAGIDLLYTSEENFCVCEINGNPGFRTAKSDIPAEIFRNFDI